MDQPTTGDAPDPNRHLSNRCLTIVDTFRERFASHSSGILVPVDPFADLVPPLSSSEALFIRNVLDRLRRLESRTRGSYAEALVCDLLSGAELTTYAVSPYDVIWDGITIAVRTTGSRNADHSPDTPPQAGSWNFPPVASWDPDNPEVSEKRRCWAAVAVLAFHDGFDLAAGWRFYVMSADQLDTFPSKRITLRGLEREGINAVGPGSLPAAIRAAVRRSDER